MFKLFTKKALSETAPAIPAVEKPQYEHDVGRVYVRFHFEDTSKYDHSESFVGEVFPYHWDKSMKVHTGKSRFTDRFNYIRERGYFIFDIKNGEKTLIPFHCLKSMTYKEESWIVQGEYAKVYSEGF